MKFIESEWNGGCQGLGEGGNEELVINGQKVSVEQDEDTVELCRQHCLQSPPIHRTLRSLLRRYIAC